MDAHIGPSTVAGRVTAPPSKSYTHRALLAAGYGEGTAVAGPLHSADPAATARAVTAFGGTVDWDDDAGVARVEGFDGRPETPADVVDCGNSGTTMRLTAAAGALADGLVVLTGDESLRSRPQGPLLAAVESLGGRADSTRDNGQAPLVVGRGETLVDGGRVSIPGDVSSQFVTALLMAGAVTPEGVEIELETALKSAPYVEITRELLADFGVETERTDAGFAVAGGQTYAADRYAVPGDFSSISYPLAAGAVAADEAPVVIEGARPSAQGDTAIVEIAGRMGADVSWDREAGELTVARAPLSGVEVSVADTPDLLPTIAVLGAVADGDTRIVDAEHVRYKETDRVAAMAESLDRLGASVTEEADALIVHGDDSTLSGATVDGRGDHRLVMALAVAGLVADGETTVRGAEHVEVSFPGFFETLAGIGADVELGE
ncbi:3-phosphoshikimate 1-carboxyvinyltransferase [Halobaculum sp. MBLA0143]|uniref:3-phosphoshikimate 1-carboxyvinyltransferase n=1 Tax=Halobaculum sp. MBLA0143 TaxID=3079933 RepID=UPI0035252EA2